VVLTSRPCSSRCAPRVRCMPRWWCDDARRAPPDPRRGRRSARAAATDGQRHGVAVPEPDVPSHA
jgi:hypothetical protein